MTGGRAADARAAALDAYLARQALEGFRVETRSRTQAVIVRRHRLHFALRWVTRGRAEQRLVVSVDEHGEVTSLAAEPVRW
jgi:ABC-type phosphate/phosphonate transport system ATPase subunit